MNENVILVVDYKKICRLCLHSTGAMSDLLDHNGENSLKELVHHATGLEIEQHDGFPTKICHRCRYIVELNCELRDMVAKTNKLLANAGNHIEVNQQKETITEPQMQPQININTAFKNPPKREKPDLRLIMQDDGVMALVKPNPGTSVDDEPDIANLDDGDDNETGKEIESDNQDENGPTKSRKTLPKNLTCQLCLNTFTTEEYVRDHVKIHYVDSKLTPYLELQRPYKCEVCNRSVSKTQLIKHHRSHLNINPYVCKHAGCGYIGKSQDSLRRHCTVHGARSQICERCGAAYKRRSELRSHMKRAHLATAARASHTTLHHRPRQHKCQWPGCTKAYNSQSSLLVHMRSHTNEREFRCHLCSVAAYTSQSLLNRHIRMHDRARPSKCDKCSASFEDYGAYYTHRIAQHGQWLAHKCIGCNKRYQTEEILDKHLQVCEKVTNMSLDNKIQCYNAIQCQEKTQKVLVSSIQDIMDSPHDHLEAQGDNLLDKFKGQSLLLQPGNIAELSKGLVIQDLPVNGLLYIEVDAEVDVNGAWKQ